MEKELKNILDPESPLMEKFRELAPGTYRHCESVAHLTDAIAAELDIDRSILFPAAKLHDIGKMCNPEFFCENQTDDVNIHDGLTPEMSYQYISRHVSDGLMILIQEPCIPRDVLELVSQHHGDSVIQSICGDKNPDDFRYKSSPPRSVEACTLMICDVVEAATRSMFSDGKLDNIKDVVTTLIDNLVEDKQLDFLRIGQLRVIRSILVGEIGSLYHKRVVYDDKKPNKDKDIAG